MNATYPVGLLTFGLTLAVLVPSQLVAAQDSITHTYQMISGSFTWHQAKADAEARGGHLATITSPAEIDSIRSLNVTTAEPYWLGATDEGHEGTWKWVTGEQWGFTLWHVGEPNNSGDESYLTASKSNDEEWNDWGQQADTLSYYLLEVDHALPFMVIVPGTSDPWLAGLPNGSSASGGDTAPAQSPVLVRSFGVDLGYGLAFDVTGLVDNGPGEGWPPDGVNMQGHDALTENGMSNITAPKDCLLGVFLGADRPDLTPAPAALSFNRNGALNFQTLRPLLKQVFFIGDGRATDERIQLFVPPAGATRLFLGTMDGSGWYNNVGQFSVTMSVQKLPLSLSIEVADVDLCWPSLPNHWYQIEYRLPVTTSSWTGLGGRVLGTGEEICVREAVRGQAGRVYRLLELP